MKKLSILDKLYFCKWMLWWKWIEHKRHKTEKIIQKILQEEKLNETNN